MLLCVVFHKVLIERVMQNEILVKSLNQKYFLIPPPRFKQFRLINFDATQQQQKQQRRTATTTENNNNLNSLDSLTVHAI